MRARLDALASEEVVRVDLATAASGELSLPATVSSPAPQASLVNVSLALLDILLPPKEWCVSGYLEPAVNGSVAISLNLTDRQKKLARAISIRESDFEPRPHRPNLDDVVLAVRRNGGTSGPRTDYERYARLITPCAVWLYYSTRGLIRERRGHLYRCWIWLWGERVSRAPFGVKHWESYAYSARGAELQAAENPDGAREMYAKALARDPKNRLALVNLGVLDVRYGTTHEAHVRLLCRGRDRFEAVRGLSEKADGVACVRGRFGRDIFVRRDGLWARATYNLALAETLIARLPDSRLAQLDADGHLDRRTDGQHRGRTHGQPIDVSRALRKQADGHLAELVQRLTVIQAKVPGEPRDEDDPTFYCGVMTDFAVDLESQVLIMSAGVLDDTDSSDLRVAVTDRLRLEANPRRARRQGEPTPNHVIDFVRDRGLSFRGHYNLACYFARHGDRAIGDSADQARLYRLALDELDVAVDAATEDIYSWARHDPALAGVRNYTDPEGTGARLFAKEQSTSKRKAGQRGRHHGADGDPVVGSR